MNYHKHNRKNQIISREGRTNPKQTTSTEGDAEAGASPPLLVVVAVVHWRGDNHHQPLAALDHVDY
jgi:hypothetical protein